MLTLYHHSLSVPSRFVRLALGEKRLEADLVDERPWDRREEFLLLNPAGTLPVLVENDQAVCGGRVVAEYLEESRGPADENGALMPSGPHERAEVRRLLDWFLDKFEAEVTAYLVEERIAKRERAKKGGKGGAPDSGVLRAARHNVRYHLRYVSVLMRERNWLGGDKMSYADLAAAAALSVADHLGEVPWENEPEAKNWYMRLKSRPAFRVLLGEQVRGLTPPDHYPELDF